MRSLLFVLLAISSLQLVACKDKGKELTSNSMSAAIRRFSIDSPVVWSASAPLVKAEIPFRGSVRFTGSQYVSNPTKLNLFINNYKGKGTYPIYQGSALQTDSNSAVLTYVSRNFSSISGHVQILEDNAEFYIGRFTILAKNQADTLRIEQGSFTISK